MQIEKAQGDEVCGTAKNSFDARGDISVARAGANPREGTRPVIRAGEKARVLLIDDEHIIANTLKAIFLKAGMEAEAVYSAEQALELLPSWQPNIAIIDVHLPGMNGIDLAIRFKSAYPDCKVILFSGYSSTTELLEKAQKEGYILDVLAKPVHPADLLRLVTGQLSEQSVVGTA